MWPRGQRFANQGTFGKAQVGVTIGKVQTRARSSRHELNKNEAALDHWLSTKPITERGQVVGHKMHPGSFRLGFGKEKCYFHPDAKVILRKNDMTTWAEFWDAKPRWKKKNTAGQVVGDKVHMEDDARVKIIAAAKEFPEEQFVIASRLPDGTWQQDLV